MPEVFLNKDQAAEFLGVSVHSLDRWRNQPGGPPFIKYRAGKPANGRNTAETNQRGTVLFEKEELRVWRESRKFGEALKDRICLNCRFCEMTSESLMCRATWTDLVTGDPLETPPMTARESRASYCSPAGVGFVWKK